MSTFTEAFSLMEKCIKSCDSLDQLEVTLDWVGSVMVPEKFPGEEYMVPVRYLLLDLIDARMNEIRGIGDIEEIELKTGH